MVPPARRELNFWVSRGSGCVSSVDFPSLGLHVSSSLELAREVLRRWLSFLLRARLRALRSRPLAPGPWVLYPRCLRSLPTAGTCCQGGPLGSHSVGYTSAGLCPSAEKSTTPWAPPACVHSRCPRWGRAEASGAGAGTMLSLLCARSWSY